MSKFEIPEDIRWQIDHIIEQDKLEYADNYRAFRIKDLYGHAEYVKAYDKGCCGFMDCVVRDMQGDQWVIGCDYGH